LTFKDLQKRVSLETTTQQQHGFFQRLIDRPFWIWDITEHKQEDAKRDGDCCFNHIIGLPQKDGNDKPLYDYEKIIFDTLVTQDGNKKHLWIKKATGLGVSEFMLRFMAWLCEWCFACSVRIHVELLYHSTWNIHYVISNF
jgi:hypothetical protein